MWSNGPLAVNEVNGNLVLALPGPAYPTAVGSMGASLSYNSQDTINRGLGAGWSLGYGADAGGVPARLVDHNLLAGASRFDAVEAVYDDGSSSCFTHVGQSDTYVAAPGDGTQLAKNPDGSWTLLSGGEVATYAVADGTTAVGSLATIETTSGASGNGKLTFTFSSQDASKVTSVSDETGRQVSFTWNSLNASGCSDAIVCISGPDSVTWKYIGDGSSGTSGKLVRVNDGTRDIAALGYDTSGRVNKLQNANDLDPTHASPNYDSTHALAVTYDGSNRVASVANGPISGTTSTWTFDYHRGRRRRRPRTPPTAGSLRTRRAPPPATRR
jgi:hypothetical protein